MNDNDPEKAQLKRFVNIKERPYFLGYVIPNGFLHEDLACHALWRYFVSARMNYENERDNLLAYEGDEDSDINYHQLFKGIAQWYDVAPEEMAKHWQCVDMQCTIMRLPKMPEGDRYRFNKTPEIKTDGYANRKERRAAAKNGKGVVEDGGENTD